MKNSVKIGVVGVGHLGFHHAKHLSDIGEANLIGVFDADKTKANEVARQLNIKAFDSLNSLLDEVDAMSIVTPTSTHVDVAQICIENKCHVFIEKPIATTVEEADSIIQLAKKHNSIVQVGHIERFNPALLALSDLKILEPKKSLFLTMLRFLKSSFLYPLHKIPLEIFSFIIIPSPLLLIITPSIWLTKLELSILFKLN